MPNAANCGPRTVPSSPDRLRPIPADFFRKSLIRVTFSGRCRRSGFEEYSFQWSSDASGSSRKDGFVLLCQHTNCRIVRVAKDFNQAPYLEKYQGKRFNSPNDLVYKSDGALYFTDPPYGLLKQDDDPAKELKFNGVFRYAGGKLQVVVKDLTRPNGLAFSPDEKTFYVANSDEKHKVWMRYDVAADGTVSNGKVFADVTAEKEDGLPDGMKVDLQGNVYGSGPGGVWVFSPDGKHLGTIKPPETPANCGWAEDGKTLYITARTSVYRIRLAVAGEKALYQ